MTYEEIVNEALANVGCLPEEKSTAYQHTLGGILKEQPIEPLQWRNIIPDGKVWFYDSRGNRTFLIQIDGKFYTKHSYYGDHHLLPDLNRRFEFEEEIIDLLEEWIVEDEPQPVEEEIEVVAPPMTVNGTVNGRPVVVRFNMPKFKIPKKYLKTPVVWRLLMTKLPLSVSTNINKYGPKAQKRIFEYFSKRLAKFTDEVVCANGGALCPA